MKATFVTLLLALLAVTYVNAQADQIAGDAYCNSTSCTVGPATDFFRTLDYCGPEDDPCMLFSSLFVFVCFCSLLLIVCLVHLFVGSQSPLGVNTLWTKNSTGAIQRAYSLSDVNCTGTVLNTIYFPCDGSWYEQAVVRGAGRRRK
jgi:hypothetical protein